MSGKKLDAVLAERMGRNLRKWRIERKMSQLELAQALGYTDEKQVQIAKNKISRMERGAGTIPLNLIFPLSDILRIPFYELFRDVEGWTATTESEFLTHFMLEKTLNEGEAEELELFRSLNHVDQYKAIEYMRLLQFFEENKK